MIFKSNTKHWQLMEKNKECYNITTRWFCQGMQNELENKESMRKSTEEHRAENHGQ